LREELTGKSSLVLGRWSLPKPGNLALCVHPLTSTDEDAHRSIDK